MYYLMPDGTSIYLTPVKSIADFSSGSAVYKIQVDFRIATQTDYITSGKSIIIPVPSGTADFINKFTSLKDSFFVSLTEQQVWDLIIQYGAISGGKLVDDNFTEIEEK